MTGADGSPDPVASAERDPGAVDGDALLGKLTRFGRLLHAAGMPVGVDRVIGAAQALARIDVTRRHDFYWALHALLVSDHREHQLFDESFRLFWREHKAEPVLGAAPQFGGNPARRAALRRVADAFATERRTIDSGMARVVAADAERPPAAPSHSDRELLSSKDFEQMTAAELERAQRAIAELSLSLPPVPTRRLRSDPRGSRIDLPATLRASARSFGAGVPLRFRDRRWRPAPLVVVADISGSMERYSRVALQLMHGLLANGHRRDVHCFVFGTRLTNITHTLRERDVDVALERVGSSVKDWTGGTRIGACLAEFNRRWARRVLGQNALVLLISDGLDRDDAAGIGEAMERLHKSCRRLIWLNPLLRYAGFEPQAAGIRAMLPHVDELRPVHNLRSLVDLVNALKGSVAPHGREPGTPSGALYRPPPLPQRTGPVGSPLR